MPAQLLHFHSGQCDGVIIFYANISEMIDPSQFFGGGMPKKYVIVGAKSISLKCFCKRYPSFIPGPFATKGTLSDPRPNVADGRLELW